VGSINKTQRFNYFALLLLMSRRTVAYMIKYTRMFACNNDGDRKVPHEKLQVDLRGAKRPFRGGLLRTLSLCNYTVQRPGPIHKWEIYFSY